MEIDHRKGNSRGVVNEASGMLGIVRVEAPCDVGRDRRRLEVEERWICFMGSLKGWREQSALGHKRLEAESKRRVRA
jgi:hypothetical protein